MEIRVCPKCGEEDIEEASWSDGYDMGWSKDCTNCDWYYASEVVGSSGTHPREFERYCADCGVVFETIDKQNNHICTVDEFIKSKKKPIKLQNMIDYLLENNRTRLQIKDEILEEARADNIEVIPMETFTSVQRLDNESELDQLLLGTIESLGHVTIQEICEELHVTHEITENIIRERLRKLNKHNEIHFGVGEDFGIEIRDE